MAINKNTKSAIEYYVNDSIKRGWNVTDVKIQDRPYTAISKFGIQSGIDKGVYFVVEGKGEIAIASGSMRTAIEMADYARTLFAEARLTC